jgi:regulation of enolase protein 1 (concanavalin A-like superfamily)
MVTNAKPIPKVDFANDPVEKIEEWIGKLKGDNWVVYEPLRQAMAPVKISLPALPQVTEPVLRTVAPASTGLPGFVLADVGDAKAGSVVANGDTVELYGGGSDVWNASDGFTFAHQQVQGDFVAEATVTSMDDLQQYAKSGLMLRKELSHDSNHFLVSSFPDGGIQAAERKAKAAGTNGTGDGSSDMPVTLRLERKGTVVTASYKAAGKPEWVVVCTSDRPDLAGSAYLGLVASSHDTGSFIKVGYRDVRFFVEK